MSKDIKVNKLKNEEFKIWKKSIPSLYQHISYFKPLLDSRPGDILQFEKKFTFANKVIPEQKKGILNAGLFYSVRSNVYAMDCTLPLGLQYLEGVDQELGDPQYHDIFKQLPGESTFPNPRWVFPGETITKMSFLPSDDNTLLTLASTGSLAWFQNGSKGPAHVMQEIMGPSTDFSTMHSIRNSRSPTTCDFDLCRDKKQLVKCQSDIKENRGTIKIIDNSEKIGSSIRRFNVPTSAINSARFLDNNLFVTCSDSNMITFWDTRSSSELWSISDSQDGNLISLSTSPEIYGLFATGTDIGVIKLWDIRATMSQEQQAMANFYHTNEDAVIDLQFSPTRFTEFLSVGESGNVYQWDSEFFFASDEVDEEDLQLQCLKFLHTGGSRRSIGTNDKRNTVSWHPTIDQLIGTIDNDCSITVYKAFTGDQEEEKEEEKEGKDKENEPDE